MRCTHKRRQKHKNGHIYQCTETHVYNTHKRLASPRRLRDHGTWRPGRGAQRDPRGTYVRRQGDLLARPWRTHSHTHTHKGSCNDPGHFLWLPLKSGSCAGFHRHTRFISRLSTASDSMGYHIVQWREQGMQGKYGSRSH